MRSWGDVGRLRTIGSAPSSTMRTNANVSAAATAALHDVAALVGSARLQHYTDLGRGAVEFGSQLVALEFRLVLPSKSCLIKLSMLSLNADIFAHS